MNKKTTREPDEPPATTAVQDSLTISQTEPAEQPETTPDPKTSPRLPMILPADPTVVTAVLSGEDVSTEPSREPDAAVTVASNTRPFHREDPLLTNCSAG